MFLWDNDGVISRILKLRYTKKKGSLIMKHLCNKVERCVDYTGYMQIKVLDKLGLLRRETDALGDYQLRVLNWFTFYAILTAIGFIVVDGTLFELISYLR